MKLAAYATRKRVLAVLIVAAAASSLAGTRWAGMLRQPLQKVLVPFADAGMFLTTTVKQRVREAFQTRPSGDDWRALERNAQALRLANDELAAALRQKDEQIQTLQGFRSQYGRDGRFPWELLEARVVMMDSLPYGQTRTVAVSGRGQAGQKAIVRLTLDPATQQRLEERQGQLPPKPYAVTASALAGQIIGASAFTASLQLVTDAGFRIKARVIRDIRKPRQIMLIDQGKLVALSAENRAVNVDAAQGDGDGGLVVRQVRKLDNILPGDSLVTRDQDATLPAEVAIGEVTEVKPADAPGFVNLRVRPYVQVDSLRQVLIVAPGN